MTHERRQRLRTSTLIAAGLIAFTFAGKLPEGVEVESLKVGEGVRITYSISSGRTHVSNVQPEPAGQ